MKKGVIFAFLLFAILTASLISAANETIEQKGYACLENKVNGKCSTLSLEEQQFSLLALAYNSNIQTECKTSLKSKSLNNECWPSTGCKIKDTSLSLIALANLGENTDSVENWLMSKNKTPSNLEWYLEIDSSQPIVAMECTISYDSISKKINIAEDKKISGELGSCLSLAYDNYWLKISNSCLNKKFIVSCKNDFLSTILYKKKNSNIWFVTPEVKSASANGNTEHEINSYCLATGADCNYEDNLWAALALTRKDKDITPLLPYLVAFADDNEKLFPSSFLYSLTNSEDYLAKILSLQKSDGYWLLNQKFYDTALGLLFLEEQEAETKAKDWLKNIQGTDGCWNNGNIRDTSFLLWAGWPRTPVIGPINGSDIAECNTQRNLYCISHGECQEVNGNVQSAFHCSTPQVCCDKPAREKSCRELNGEICTGDNECSINVSSASDTQQCCLGTCQPATNDCEEESNRHSCKSECSDSEEEESSLSGDCSAGQKCCKPKATPPTSKKSYLWLWILIILIILVVLGIIFRDKLRIWLFKMRGGFKQGEVPKTRPPFYPPSGIRPAQSPFSRPVFRPMPAQSFPQQKPIQPTSQPKSSKPLPQKKSSSDDELEDTLKKLKEMSK